MFLCAIPLRPYPTLSHHRCCSHRLVLLQAANFPGKARRRRHPPPPRPHCVSLKHRRRLPRSPVATPFPANDVSSGMCYEKSGKAKRRIERLIFFLNDQKRQFSSHALTLFARRSADETIAAAPSSSAAVAHRRRITSYKSTVEGDGEQERRRRLATESQSGDRRRCCRRAPSSSAAVTHRRRIPSTVGWNGEREYAVTSSPQQTKRPNMCGY